ncbi:hypothetical protein [Hufsiella ginkgonis]|uniref:Uncharacterized protein n=1 Tax=Hufsiella ginkgonis TaxID=2695274 RepID=A0A7K1Y0G6_9SPHI|nr:hypothetical protein [Hufsiella ginkgonis]MXV16499.1 hypothetical protein [Hufsiella ginkgonis]
MIDSAQISTSVAFTRLIQEKNEVETVDGNGNLLHVQVKLSRLLGSESLLSKFNKVSQNDEPDSFWYDMYIGHIKARRGPLVFVCYPYITLSTYIDRDIIGANAVRRYIKPEVESVLNHLKYNPNDRYNGLKVEISKYSAAVKDDTANKINILGNSPLKSRVYNLLSSDNQISIEPLSLKLNCELPEENRVLELSFDKLGNLRFWLKRNRTADIGDILARAVTFFEESNSLYESSFINKKSLLEDES